MADQSLINQAINDANLFGIPADLFVSQIQQESSFNPNPSGGVPNGGIGQFQPATAQELGINPLDPSQGLFGAAEYDALLYKQTGSYASMLQHYGTVPSSGPVNQNQANLLNAAQALDSGNTSGSAGASGISGSSAGGSTDSSSGIGGIGTSALSAINPVFGLAGMLLGSGNNSGNYFTRGICVILGFIFIAVGLFSLGGGKTKTIVIASKQAAKMAVAE